MVSLLLSIDIGRRVFINAEASLFEIDWGDETTNSNAVHDYLQPGQYHVRIRGENLYKLKFVSCGCVKASINCPDLRTIDCRNNPLQKLQLNFCNSLTGLSCANCLLEELNLSEAPALRWVNCCYNSIKKINGLSNIIILEASNNLLHALNLENYKKITYLNLENNQFSTIGLNDLLTRLSAQPRMTDMYVSFAGNPGEASCNTSVLEVKSCNINTIPVPSDPVKETETELPLPPPPTATNASSPYQSVIRLLFYIRFSGVEIVIHAKAENVLYIWSASEISTGPTGKYTISANQGETHEVYVFATQLDSFCIEGTPCLAIHLQSPTLKALNVNRTLIRELDLSQFPLLKHLECSDTSLEKLDLSPCNELCMLVCNNNQLQSLKVNKMMVHLACCRNRLKELSVTGCKHLCTLEICENEIEKLYIEECPNLRFLFINGNCLEDLNPIFSQLPDQGYMMTGDKASGIISFQNNPGTSRADQDVLMEKGWVSLEDKNLCDSEKLFRND